MENYMNCISDPKLRRSILKFRVSSHALGVEKSRHKRNQGQGTISNMCLTCNLVEDEKHFILHCPIGMCKIRHRDDNGVAQGD